MRVVDYREYTKNTLRGFVDLELLDSGVVIKEAPYHEKNGAAWFGMGWSGVYPSDGFPDYSSYNRAENYWSELDRAGVVTGHHPYSRPGVMNDGRKLVNVCQKLPSADCASRPSTWRR